MIKNTFVFALQRCSFNLSPLMPLPTSLETVRPAWQEQLQAWAADGSLASAARHALELGAEDPPLLSELVSQWTEGDFSALPPIVLLPASSMPGAERLELLHAPFSQPDPL